MGGEASSEPRAFHCRLICSVLRLFREDSVMPRPRSERTALAAAAGLAIAFVAAPLVQAQSDLDAFMRQVMERRDDNWKKLQQYILDEREELDIRGPGKLPLWG